MKNGRNITALLAGFLLLAMAGSKEWIIDIWKQLKPLEKIFWVAVFITAIVAAFIVAIVPVIWEWGQWLLLHF